MKYKKKFRINDDPKKIHLRIQIVKGYLKGKSLSEIARSENCTIKTAKFWVDRYKNTHQKNQMRLHKIIDKLIKILNLDLLKGKEDYLYFIKYKDIS